MARFLVTALALCATVLPSSLASSPAAKRQGETAALTALTAGPVSYSSLASTCTARCAAMVASASTCTEDQCACAASAQTVTCMNCVLENASAAQGTQVTGGFEEYAQACVDEGYLEDVPALQQVAAVTSSSSSSVSSSSASLSSSSSSGLSSSLSASSSSATSASRTSSAVSATSTAGYTAFSTWLVAVGNAVCTTECTPVQNAFAACAATDTCVCTAANFASGQTCEDCLNLNEEGYWTTANLQQIASLWAAAGQACSVSVTTAGAAAPTTQRSSSLANTLRPSTTGVPRQSYFQPSTTASSTAPDAQRTTGGPNGSSGGTSAGSRALGLSGAAVALVVGALGGAFVLA